MAILTRESLIRKIPQALAMLALVIWFGQFVLFEQYDETRPASPEVYAGRVFPQNKHGHVVYLTAEEEFRINFISGSAFVLFMTGFLIQHVRDHPEFKQDANGVMLRMFFGLLSPIGWYLGLLDAWRAVAQTAKKGPRRLFLETHMPFPRRHQTTVLIVDLGISECQTRIKNAFGFATYGVSFSGKDNRKFQVWKSIRNYRNSFAPVFSGKLLESPGGTRVEGSFGSAQFARVFSWLWFGTAIAIGVYLMVLGVQDVFGRANYFHGNAYTAIFFPLALVLAGILIVSCCKKLGEDEEIEIMALLRKALGVSPSNASTADQ